jgi:hypothetical protein
LNETKTQEEINVRKMKKIRMKGGYLKETNA